MKFQINDFLVFITNKTEKLSQEIGTVTLVNSGKNQYSMKPKEREFHVFDTLKLIEKENNGEYYVVIKNVFDFIDLIEILKAFSNNKLDTQKEYSINNCFKAKIVQKDGNISLRIQFQNHSSILYYDKFESISLAAKFSKILQKCEAWQE